VTDISPGWYKDPADPDTQRYWDGEGWIGHALPADVEAPPGPPPAEDVPASPPIGATPPVDATAPVGPAAAGGDRPVGAAPPVPSSAAPSPPPGPSPTAAPAPVRPPPVNAPGVEPAPVGPPPVNGPAVSGGPPPGWPYPLYPHPARVPPPRPHGLLLATPGARLVARLIDIGALALLNLVVNGWFVWQYAVEIAPTLEAWERYFLRETTETPAEASPRSGYLQVVIVLIAAALWLAYEVPAVANNGQTFGKRVLGIRVVRVEEPGPIGFGRSLRRWNTLGLPTLLWPCCGIGFVLQFVDAVYLLADRPLLQSLHDRSARTVVVRVGTGSGSGVGSAAGIDSGAGSGIDSGADAAIGSGAEPGPVGDKDKTDNPGGSA
jgi:uncharacterized RDD family membrane protein YckC